MEGKNEEYKDIYYRIIYNKTNSRMIKKIRVFECRGKLYLFIRKIKKNRLKYEGKFFKEY